MSGLVAKLFSKHKKKKNAPSLTEVTQNAAETAAAKISVRYPISEDTDVRLLLATRLSDLFPALGLSDLARFYAFVVQSLGTFALDEILKVRLALSSALKDLSDFSPREAAEFVSEAEQDVSEPILRFCAGLQDEDLLSILSLHKDPAIHRAVRAYERERLAPSVTDERQDMRYEDIVSAAKQTREWKEHSGVHLEMPAHVISEMAQFIDDAVRTGLRDRAKLDYETVEDIVCTFRNRMRLIDLKNNKNLLVRDRMEYLLQNGGLGNESILDALAVRDFPLVILALSTLSGASVKVIDDVVAARAPSPLVALCWKAGLSMRLALALQRDLAEISGRRLIYPKSGTDYPFTEKEMREQLDFLGVNR